MQFNILTRSDFKITKWSGGTTTQLYIHPPQADFASHDFDFRISTATVEQPESDFTPLPGFKRILLVLDGEIKIHHQNHGSAHLFPFLPHHFDGSWQTRSEGTCTDFNIIYKPHYKADFKLLSSADHAIDTHKSEFLFVFCVKGGATISYCENEFRIIPNQLLCFTDIADNLIKIKQEIHTQILEIRLSPIFT